MISVCEVIHLIGTHLIGHITYHMNTEDTIETNASQCREFMQECLKSSKDTKKAMFDLMADFSIDEDISSLKIFSDLLTYQFVMLIPLRSIYRQGDNLEKRDVFGMGFSWAILMNALDLLGFRGFLYTSAAMTSCFLGEFIVEHGYDMLMIYREANTARVRLGIDDITRFDLVMELFSTAFNGLVSLSCWIFIPEAALPADFMSQVSGIVILNTVWNIMDLIEVAISLILLGMENYRIYQMSPLRRRLG